MVRMLNWPRILRLRSSLRVLEGDSDCIAVYTFRVRVRVSVRVRVRVRVRQAHRRDDVQNRHHH